MTDPAYGLSVAGLANHLLDHLRGGAAWAMPASLYAQLHTGMPGPDGTANVSTNGHRDKVTFGAAANGQMSLSGVPPLFTMTQSETIVGVSFWDASTGGNFLWSAGLVQAKTVDAGDTLTVASSQLSFVTLAA